MKGRPNNLQINAASRMSDEKRNETQLLCDTLGLKSLVDEITAASHPSTYIHPTQTPSTLAPRASSTSTSEPHPTPSTILGPFHRPNAPILPTDPSIVSPDPAYTPFPAHFSGRVLSTQGAPIPSATLDIWHTAPNIRAAGRQPTRFPPQRPLRNRR